ncbi:MAG: chloride channel protein [Candidatus Lernaella stagnicola]|nr:chloride channel protein [Candidatus Lernaella stagnicola]
MSNFWSSIREHAQRILERGRGNEDSYLLVVATLIGVGGGLGAIGFRNLIYYFQKGFLLYASALHWLVAREWVTYVTLWDIPFWTKFLIPATGGLIVGPLIYFFAREAKGHGVPEVMAAVALQRGHIRKRLVIFKALASALTIASGGSAGREGPIVHIGSAWGSTIGQLFRVSPQRMKIFVGCGAAAGIAATFNAPIAGMFFSLEIILGDFAVGTLSAVAISSVIATVVARAFEGDNLALVLPRVFSLSSPWEIFTYLGLGVAAGITAVAFTATLSKAEDIFDKVKLPPWFKPVVGGMLVGLIGVWFPQVFGVGYDSIDAVFAGELALGFMALLVLAKILATSLTLGGGMSGGIFAPSLLIGCLLGASYGGVVHSLLPGVTAPAGAYALVGMAGVVAAATNAPITAMLILFEMTGNYQIILALILTCAVSNIIARALMRDSIYTIRHTKNGINIHGGREQSILQGLQVRDIMKTDHEPIPRWLPFDAVVKVVLSRDETDFFVTDEEGRLVGDINLHIIKDVLTDQGLSSLVLADDLMLSNVVSITPNTNLADAMKLMSHRHVDVIPVVQSASDQTFLGVLYRSDLIDAYNREILRQSALGVRYMRSDQQATREQQLAMSDVVEVERGQITQEITVSRSLAGRSLADLNIRTRFRVNVVAMRDADDPGGMHPHVPDPTIRLYPGQVLVCVGTPENLAAFQHVVEKE